MTQFYVVGGFIVFLILAFAVFGYWMYKRGADQEDYESRKKSQELSNKIEDHRSELEHEHKAQDLSNKPMSKLLDLFNRGVSKTDKPK